MSNLEPIVKPNLDAGVDIFPKAYDAQWLDFAKVTDQVDIGSLQSLRALQITLVNDQNRCIENAEGADKRGNLQERMIWNACASVLAGHIAGTADAMIHIAGKYKGALKSIHAASGVLNG